MDESLEMVKITSLLPVWNAISGWNSLASKWTKIPMLRKWSPKNGHGIHTCIQYTQYKCCNTLSDPTSLPIGSRWLLTYLISLSIKLPISWFAFEEPQASDLSSRSTHGGPWHPFTHQGKRYHVALLDGWQLTCFYKLIPSHFGICLPPTHGVKSAKVQGWWNLSFKQPAFWIVEFPSTFFRGNWVGPKEMCEIHAKYRKVFLYMMKTELNILFMAK